MDERILRSLVSLGGGMPKDLIGGMPKDLIGSLILQIGDHSLNQQLTLIPMVTYHQEMHTFEVRDTKTMGRGVFAKNALQPGDILLKVSSTQYITYEAIVQHPFFSRMLNETKDKKMEFAFFMSFIHNLKQISEVERPMWNYLQQLPKKYDNLICWSDKELHFLRDIPLRDKIIEKKKQLAQTFQEMKDKLTTWNSISNQMPEEQNLTNEESIPTIRGTRTQTSQQRLSQNEENIERQEKAKAEKFLQNLKEVTLESALQFYAAIESRNIYYPDTNDQKSQVGALIPDLQMFNHDKGSKCNVEITYNEVVVTVKAPIKAGEEIFVNYGDMFTADYFLQCYGMIPEDFIKEKPLKKGKQNRSLESLILHKKQTKQIIPNLAVSQPNIPRSRISLARIYNSIFGINQQVSSPSKQIKDIQNY